jgi:hypothetical protein
MSIWKANGQRSTDNVVPVISSYRFCLVSYCLTIFRPVLSRQIHTATEVTKVPYSDIVSSPYPTGHEQ